MYTHAHTRPDMAVSGVEALDYTRPVPWRTSKPNRLKSWTINCLIMRTNMADEQSQRTRSNANTRKSGPTPSYTNDDCELGHETRCCLHTNIPL